MAISEFYKKVGSQVRPSNPPHRKHALGETNNGIIDEYDPDAEHPQQVGVFNPLLNKRLWKVGDKQYRPAGVVCEKIPAGAYTTLQDNMGPFFQVMDVKTDDLIILPDNQFRNIIDEFKRFWTLKEEFTKRGFLHKRGFLFWGPAGSGKTSLLQILAATVIKELDGMIIYCPFPAVAEKILPSLREIEPNRPLIAVLEDIDAIIESQNEALVLSLLDGETQIDNVIYIATTNYPERLDRRIVDRPSRFDTVQKIDMPSAVSRRHYLSNKETSLVGEELEKWVRISDGLGIAHLKEMIIANRCFGQPIDEVVKRLKEMHEGQKSSTDFLRKAGFHNEDGDEVTNKAEGYRE